MQTNQETAAPTVPYKETTAEVPSLNQVLVPDLTGMMPPNFGFQMVALQETHLSPYTELTTAAAQIVQAFAHVLLPMIHHPETRDQPLDDALGLLRSSFATAYPGLAVNFRWQPHDDRSGMYDYKNMTVGHLADIKALLYIILGPSIGSTYLHSLNHKNGQLH